MDYPTAEVIHNKKMQATAVAAAVAAFVIVCVGAWVSDDAFITLRVVHNFVGGYGLRWNLDERVQVYTHPLWMMLLSVFYFVTREAYYTTIVAGLIATIATMVVLWRALSPPQRLIVLLLLALSRAFVDYSTSGLENPFSHLLLALLVVHVIQRGHFVRHRYVVLIAGLLLVTRLDLVLLVAPVLVYFLYSNRERPRMEKLSAVAIALTPITIWILFSLIYYGFPFPNTAYAKLGHGIERGELLYRGVMYLWHSVRTDFLTIAVIVLQLFLAGWRGSTVERYIATGVAAYLGYVVWIGGDFMGGRFLSAPFILAAVPAAVRISAVRAPRGFGYAVACIVALGCVAKYPTFLPTAKTTGAEFRGFIDRAGVADERRHYLWQSSLLYTSGQQIRNRMNQMLPGYMRDGQGEAIVAHSVGMIGYYFPSQVHIIDQFGICDPLLSRMPAVEGHNWRIGHLPRAIPHGYLETVSTGRMQFEDPAVAQYYERLRVVTSSPLFSLERFSAIISLNTRDDAALHAYRSAEDTVRYSDVASKELATPLPITTRGIDFVLEQPRRISSVDVGMSGGMQYGLVLFRGRKAIREVSITAADAPGHTVYRADFQKEQLVADRVRVRSKVWRKGAISSLLLR